ncbi:serine/threonine protein kinase [bacterium]|nr:serine/threonine protein kinase [bacterium]
MSARVAYELLEELGRGGKGVVSRARAPDGREVAIRKLDRGAEPALRRLERERSLRGALLEADGFVPVLEIRPGEERPFIVTPLLARGTLRDRLREGPIPARETIEIARVLARSLGRAHKAGYVHLDLRPENVFLGEDGTWLVAGLGLARHFRESAQAAEERRELDPYKAPEQHERSRAVGFAADVYALGAIICECLLGEPPRPGETLEILLARLGLSRLPGVPGSFAYVVERCVALDPQERYGSGNALALALDIQRGLGRILSAALLLVVLASMLCVASPTLFVRAMGLAFAVQLVGYAVLSFQGLHMQVGEQQKAKRTH